MPTYEYKCENGHQFEVVQRMTDDALTTCPTCGAPVQRVFHPVAVHFKGSGFYNTDYGTRRRSREAAENESKKAGESKADSGSGDSKGSDGGSKSGESKSDSGSKAAKGDSSKKPSAAAS